MGGKTGIRKTIIVLVSVLVAILLLTFWRYGG